jgi:ribose-phosphate pyrophosphokinase
MYSDNTPMVKTEDWSTIVEHADTVVLRADSLHEFMVGMFLVDVLNEAPGRYFKGGLNLVLPYLPGARQDRSNPTGDVLFSARSIAREINLRRFSKVVSVDPHSPVMPRYIQNFREYPLERVAEKFWKGYTGVIAPDKGAKDRASRVANAMGLPVYFGGKTRDVSTGALTGFEVEELPKGGHFLVADDICDGGGTFIGLGEKIREQGCYADLFVTHGIFSKGTRGMKEIFKNIYTTDTRQINTDRRTQVMKFNIVDDMVNY